MSSHNAWASDNTAGAGALGEHNEQVLREYLGRSRDSIGKLAMEGVLCSKRPEPAVDP